MRILTRRHSTIPGKLLKLFRRDALPEITTFEQLQSYGPSSCTDKTFHHVTIKELFNEIPADTSHPQSSGLFGNPLLASSKGFYQYWFMCEEHCNKLIKEITSSPASSETLRLFDDLSNSICLFADCIKFVAENAPSKSVAEAAHVNSINAHNFVEKLNTNLELYHKLKSVAEDPEIVKEFDHEDLLTLNSLILDMELSGIHLPENVRERYVDYNQEIGEAGAKFVSLSHQPVLLSEVPEALRNLPARNNYKVLAGSGSEHFMPDVREFAWKNYHGFNEDRETALHSLLTSRNAMARSVGFSSFAERELRHTMAGTPEKVSSFLNELHDELKPEVENELDHIKFAKSNDVRHDFNEPIINSSCAKYYSQTLSQSFLLENHTHGSMFLDLLEIGNVIDGLNTFCEDILRISLVPEVPMRGELVNKDVVKLALYDEVEGLVGYIYADLYERKNKEPRTCLHTITCGTAKQIPVVVLQCCFEQKTQKQVNVGYPKISFDELQTLFHELGHAIHAILGRTKYQHTSGTRGPTDFAEIPSTLFENFICHPEIFYRCVAPYTLFEPSHFQHGTENLFNTPYKALETETSIIHSLLDQGLHSANVPDRTTTMSDELFARYSHLTPVEGSAWHHRFAHLNYYGARYYSYLWARSIANLVFYNMFYDDPFNEAAGKQLKEFLKRGSGSDFQASLEDLVGYKFGQSEMVGAIVEPIKRFNRSYLDEQDISKKWW